MMMMSPPTPYQKMGFDKEYNKELMDDWKANNRGEPPPIGAFRFFPLTTKTQEKQSGQSDNHS